MVPGRRKPLARDAGGALSSKISVKAVGKVFDVAGGSFQALHDINLKSVRRNSSASSGPAAAEVDIAAHVGGSTRRRRGRSGCGTTLPAVR
jgi:hypothetical protein